MAHDLAALPKAHLHLHLTGGMRHSTLVELAQVEVHSASSQTLLGEEQLLARLGDPAPAR